MLKLTHPPICRLNFTHLQSRQKCNPRRRREHRGSRQSAVHGLTNGQAWWHNGDTHWKLADSRDALREITAESSKPVLVDCFTPWCGPCKMIDPQLSRLAADGELQEICTFVRVNTDDMSDWAAEAKVQALPYVVIYDGSESFPAPAYSMQISLQRMKVLRHAIQTIATNRGAKFVTDPNGYATVL